MNAQQASNIKIAKGTEITKLETMRVKRNLSQADLANLTGLSLRRIQAYEQRNRSIDSSRLSALLDICVALKCNLDDIIEEQESIEKLKQLSNISHEDETEYVENHFEVQRKLYLKMFNQNDFTDDQKEGVNFLLRDFSDNWKRVLKLRYEKRLTQEQIGNECGISKARVGQIIEKALYRLKEIESSDYVIYGLDTCRKREEQKKKNRSLDEIPINELNLTGRAYNCLMRSGLNTIGKLITIKREELLAIKQMNEACVNEILSKLDNYK